MRSARTTRSGWKKSVAAAAAVAFVGVASACGSEAGGAGEPGVIEPVDDARDVEDDARDRQQEMQTDPPSEGGDGAYTDASQGAAM
jgi:hypothetical protein